MPTDVAFMGSEYVNASDDAVAATKQRPGARLTADVIEARRRIRADALAHYEGLVAKGMTYRCHGRQANTAEDFVAATVEWREIDGRDGFPPCPMLPPDAPAKAPKSTTARAPGRPRKRKYVTPDGIRRPRVQYMKPAKRRAIALTGDGWDEFRNATVIDSNRWPGA